MDDDIRLDRKAFKALSSDSRVAILKSLARRRKMLAELSTQLDMSPSTMKEHMDSLVSAGLVAKIDDGHKWKYYELTRSGKNVVTPGETRIFVIIGIASMALLFTGYMFIGGFQSASFQSLSSEKGLANDVLTAPAAPAATAELAQSVGMGYYAAGFIVFALILGTSIGYVIGKRKMQACLD